MEAGNESLKKMIDQTGTYILMDGNDGGVKREAYIGESENVLVRLKQHNSAKGTKDLWVDTIVLVSKDESLTKSHVMYVESLLLSEVSEAKNHRWKFSANDRTPSETAGGLPEADRMHMKKFVADAKILVGMLGCDIFIPTTQVDADQPPFSLIGKGYAAKMRLNTSNGFIVTAGSKAKKDLAPTTPTVVKNLRHAMEEAGHLRPSDSSLMFTSDYPFSSVSTAAGVVCGRSINGRTAWRNDEGKTFREWEAAQTGSSSKDT